MAAAAVGTTAILADPTVNVAEVVGGCGKQKQRSREEMEAAKTIAKAANSSSGGSKGW